MLGNVKGKITMEMERMILKLGHHLLRKLSWFSLISSFLLAPLSEANSNNTSFGTAGVYWPDIINCNTSYRPTNPEPFSGISNLDGAIPFANPDGICSGDAYYNDLIFQVYLGNFVGLAGDTTIRVNRSKYYGRFSKANQAYSHDHRKTGRRNIKHKQVFPVKLTLGLGVFCLFMSFGITGVYSSVKKRKFINLKAKFFQQNGGLLLEQHIASHGSTKVFTAEELETAAAYYNQSHNFCPGESALDCKGLLSDGAAIVDMRKTVVHEGQIERFIHEIVTLTKIKHKNVVKFLGCCLETEAPMLVYEFPCNGTLFDYIHHANGKSALPWHVLLKIASDSAIALAYMHSAVDSLKPMIIHGNVNSSNIFLTDCFVAKVSGFSPSRLVPVPSNESQMKTLVQQTLGYLDPEYLYTGQLTDKSDVYSFGIVLLELLTGEMPLSFHRPENRRIVTSHFVSSVGQNDIFQIIVPQLVNEGNREQLRAVAELAKSCLKLSSAERPAMEEVARELRRLCGGTHSS